MKRTVTLLTLLLVAAVCSQAQPQLQKDYAFVMEIPSTIAMESSAAHLYVLSETEGMAVFRTRPDTLQWLYTSAGMQQRGEVITADIRFAYLFGDSRRLTVLEPTTVLGVYSSTTLPARPIDAERIGEQLFLALGEEGLGQISLRSESAVDSAVAYPGENRIGGASIVSVERSGNRLHVLASGGTLFTLIRGDDGMEVEQEVSLERELERIFMVGETLMGSGADGDIHEVGRSGSLSRLGSIGEPVTKLQGWGDWLIIQGTSGRIWTSWQNRAPVLWKDDRDAAYAFTVSKDQFWLSEYDQVSRISEASGQETASGDPVSVSETEEITLNPIPDQSVPYPKPVVVPLSLQENLPADEVQFAWQGDIRNARIRGSSFYWQPGSGDVGSHRIRIIATASNGVTDSTGFTVNVNAFNAPPRFSPLRPMTIPVNEPFTLPVRATDPDGSDRELVRYIGVDLPDGAAIDEHSGEFSWTPSARQTGENRFRIIATDQYGAAASTDVVIRVIEPSGENE